MCEQLGIVLLNQLSADFVKQLTVLYSVGDFLFRCAEELNRVLPVKLREDVVHKNMLNIPSCAVDKEG